MNSTIRSVLRTAAVIAASMAPPAPAIQLVLVDQVSLPFANPTYGLEFDESTHTFWGVNYQPGRYICHFGLQGNLLSSWPAILQDDNLTGITLDASGQRVFYYQNLGRYLQEATMDGTWERT